MKIPTCEPTPRSQILIITDISKQRLIQQLKTTTKDKNFIHYDQETDIESLERMAKNPIMIKRILEMDQVILLTGTKDIRRGMKGRDLHKRLNNLTRDIGRLTLTQLRICELPPSNGNEGISKETEIFNEALRNRTNYGITLTRIWAIRNSQAFDNNGQITELGIERIAKDIDTQAIPGNMALHQRKTTMTIAVEEMAHIIGRTGSNIKHLQNTYKVQISIRENEDDATIIIKGHPDKTSKAKEEIKYQTLPRYPYRRSRDSSPS